MAPSKPAVDFNAMIQADREKRKNQALADKILGKGRRQSAPGAAGGNNRKAPAASSMASRVGVQKRGIPPTARPKPLAKTPAANVNSEWTHDLYASNDSSTTVPRGPKNRNQRRELLSKALDRSASSPALNSQFNVVGAAQIGVGLSIKGLAGPYVVIARNFAPGTTAADIESAMSPIGGQPLSCRLIQERPTIIAEIIFESKQGADNVVDTLDSQQADGKILQVYHKQGAGKGARPSVAAPLGPKSDVVPYENYSRDSRDSRNEPRAQDRRGGYNHINRDSRSEREERDARGGVTNGNYGFDDRMDTDEIFDRPLYSDDIVGKARGNDRSRSYR